MLFSLAQELGLATPQILDLAFAIFSLTLFTLYHVWYYSWHMWGQPLPTGGVHRLDMTGQTARVLFTQAVLSTGSDADYNLVVQMMRNPITAASILGTGASVGVTTLTNTLLDSNKMEVVRQMSRRDPLTGGSSIIAPEAKLGTAVAALFLSFFALAQALRLFVHFPFLVRACHYCRTTTHAHPHAESPAGPDSGDCLASEALKTCLRGQTFFSLGLRFFYLFIPLVMWTFGGTWLLVGTLVEVTFLFILDQI